ncbi:flagellar biosynthesis anti-sigma factor FlgM [Ideonella paludis]|uniref:Negative regulator of flagellin synthesis n=1 Tax=Ideonella paludis TaxID=1233411 RepID=A0ABS5DYI3_9BURK|nr:flagellar biosynthesis anti-sigma factor FlgM [Ideonella paludis]MBQ0936213.1 flagellar biosynthesis anti-sigma factor FlgM [Ideonella paludis]
MKIGSVENKASLTPVQTERKPGSDKGVSRAEGEPSAKVAISSAASLLSQAADDPSFDAAKVERIAQAIKDGKFEINADKIADKLIANARELLERPRN